MTSARLLLFGIIQLLLTLSSGAASVGDESCLLQTSSSIKKHFGDEEEKRNDEEVSATAYLAVEEKNARTVPSFEINLDLPPQERFIQVARRFKKQFYMFYNKFGNNTGGQSMAQSAAFMRGPEASELQGEVEGIAKELGLPVFFIQQQQLAFPMQSMKGPFFKYLHSMNLSLPSDEKMYATATSPEFLKQFPQFGCTGIIARDEKDGTIWHARNLDLGFSHWLQNMTYNARFMKKGKLLFTAQMMFPFQQVSTGMRPGPNGYTYELNARYGDTAMDSKELMTNLFMNKRKLGGWIARKTLEDTPDYEDAVETFSTIPLPGKEYHIISGPKTGIVLARDPDKLAYQMDLGKNRYILMTNFDYMYDDPKEWIMWEKEVSRRVRAQKLLNESKVITPELLQRVITDDNVQNGATFFQALMSVEHNMYNTTLPHCDGCDCAPDCDAVMDYDATEGGTVSF